MTDKQAISTTEHIPLSAAIRLGSIGKKQAVEVFDDGDGAVCALGAVGCAVGIDPATYPYSAPLKRAYPELQEIELINPITGFRNSLFYIITDLNDNQCWTFGQIADWLESEDY